jgi:Ca2+-dependent lipid-binding protein
VKTSTASPKAISTSSKTETPQVPQNAESTTQSDFEELPKNTPEDIEDEHEILPEDVLQQSQKQEEKAQSENFSFILTTLIIIVSSVFLAIVALTIVYKQYRKSTDPLNYKDRSEGGGAKRADEEFSEIRYLTSDETLDFTLASPDNHATDL